MSASWNGDSLVTEFSALLGDTSTAFQTRVLGWLNDTIFDIGTRHDWGFHKVKGKKKLTANAPVNSLEIAAPSAPTLALTAGGSLTADTVYYVLVTFAQDNGVESMAGVSSASITPTGGNLSFDITNIPVSSESLVTQRHLYLKSGSTGKFYYHSTISDNSTTSASIDENTTDTTEPPDYAAIRKVVGHPFIEGSSAYLAHRPEDQIRRVTGGPLESGVPEFFDMVSENSILTYPVQSSTTDISFNYYRNPFRLYDSTDSQPDLPIKFKPILKAGVIALGFEYRDREGQEGKWQKYENLLAQAISDYSPTADIDYSVRDEYGNSDGFEVNY